MIDVTIDIQKILTSCRHQILQVKHVDQLISPNPPRFAPPPRGSPPPRGIAHPNHVRASEDARLLEVVICTQRATPTPMIFADQLGWLTWGQWSPVPHQLERQLVADRPLTALTNPQICRTRSKQTARRRDGATDHSLALGSVKEPCCV